MLGIAAQPSPRCAVHHHSDRHGTSSQLVGWRNIPIALVAPVSLVAGRAQGVPLIMDETYLQCPGSVPVDLSIAADVLLREEPDEEEDDDKKHEGDEEDDDGDEGYSE